MRKFNFDEVEKYLEQVINLDKLEFFKFIFNHVNNQKKSFKEVDTLKYKILLHEYLKELESFIKNNYPSNLKIFIFAKFYIDNKFNINFAYIKFNNLVKVLNFCKKNPSYASLVKYKIKKLKNFENYNEEILKILNSFEPTTNSLVQNFINEIEFKNEKEVIEAIVAINNKLNQELEKIYELKIINLDNLVYKDYIRRIKREHLKFIFDLEEKIEGENL